MSIDFSQQGIFRKIKGFLDDLSAASGDADHYLSIESSPHALDRVFKGLQWSAQRSKVNRLDQVVVFVVYQYRFDGRRADIKSKESLHFQTFLYFLFR